MKTLLLTAIISAVTITAIILFIPTHQTSRCQEGAFPNGTCAGPIRLNAGIISNSSIQETSYLYLFKKNNSLDDVPLTAFSEPLFRKVQNFTGIKQPSFEQIHYALSKKEFSIIQAKKLIHTAR